MTNSQDSLVVDKKTLFWNRLQLILILLVFTAPIVGAFFYKPTVFNNYGDLYSPARPVANLVMSANAIDGSTAKVELDSFRRQWVFLIIANTKCAKPCEDNILKMRQLRFMQNEDMKRIRTIFLHTNLSPIRAKDLMAKYSPVEVYTTSFDAYDEWTQILKIEDAPVEAQQDRFYIIDPAGNLVISYPATADPYSIEKDIKRLLTTS